MEKIVNEIQIIQLDSEDNFSNKYLEICLEIRRIVFCEEQGVTEEEEGDEHDCLKHKYMKFYMAKYGEKIVGTMRTRIVDECGKIERVCLLKEYRNLKIGKALILQAINDLKDSVNTIKLSSQFEAKSFYEKYGFETYGEPYYECRILHVDMKLEKK